MAWDGKERRRDANDHDTLITLVQILHSHVENFNKHVEVDETNFRDLKSTVRNIERCIWIATGIVGVFHILPNVVTLVRLLGGH